MCSGCHTKKPRVLGSVVRGASQLQRKKKIRRVRSMILVVLLHVPTLLGGWYDHDRT